MLLVVIIFILLFFVVLLIIECIKYLVALRKRVENELDHLRIQNVYPFNQEIHKELRPYLERISTILTLRELDRLASRMKDMKLRNKIREILRRLTDG